MRFATLTYLICIVACVVTSGCGAGFDCERDNSCPPAGWGKSGSSSSASTVGGASGSAGQGGSGDTGATGGGDAGGAGGTGGTGGLVCPEDPDPADGYIRDECGIWVSHSLGDDINGKGTQAAPVHTIAKAIELAQSPSQPSRIYACGEVFEEAVRLPKGITLFGGFDCGAPSGPLNWTYRGYEFRATLTPLPGAVALVFLGEPATLCPMLGIPSPMQPTPWRRAGRRSRWSDKKTRRRRAGGST